MASRPWTSLEDDIILQRVVNAITEADKNRAFQELAVELGRGVPRVWTDVIERRLWGLAVRYRGSYESYRTRIVKENDIPITAGEQWLLKQVACGYCKPEDQDGPRDAEYAATLLGRSKEWCQAHLLQLNHKRYRKGLGII